MKEPFTPPGAVIRSIVGRALPLRGHDIDTDRIIPARFLKAIVFDGLGASVFADDRAELRAMGQVHAFDEPRFAGAKLLIAGRHFGCGSSREHAPQALRRSGIEAIVAESFADIFIGNCTAIGLPCVTADAASVEALQSLCERDPGLELELCLERLELRAGRLSLTVAMPEGSRQQFLSGRWDSTAELLEAEEALRALERRLPRAPGHELASRPAGSV